MNKDSHGLESNCEEDGEWDTLYALKM
jgi:hypothetical protein